LCLSLLLLSAHIQGRLFKRANDVDSEQTRCKQDFLSWTTSIFRKPIVCSSEATAVWWGRAPVTDAQFHAYCCRMGCSKRHAEEFYCKHKT
ncbi:hypothetical protein PFISCL1PPCAC_4507, partial [Pristionchus fissidentatus]